jgi:PAS domain S-box-containing protein
MFFPNRSYHLRNFLSLMLVAVTAVTMVLVGGLVLVYRIPQINDEAKGAVQREAMDKAQLLEFALGGLESQLRPIVALAQLSSPTLIAHSLQALIGQGQQFQAVYVVNSNGIIQSGGFSRVQAAGPRPFVGGDLSRNPLFLAAQEGTSVWSDKYLSAQSGSVVIGVALRQGRLIIIGEIAPQYLRQSVSTVAGGGGDRVLVVDRTGEYIADSDNEYRSTDNLGNLLIVKAALAGQATGQQLEHHSRQVFAGSANPEKLGWTFIATRPAGMDNPDIRRTVLFIVTSIGGSLLIGLLFSPWWAHSLSRPIQRMIDRSHQIAEGHYAKTDGARSRIVELNAFGDDLQRMADAIREREESLVRSEERLRATIENSPSVAIQWYDSSGICRYWNPASTAIYGFTSEEAVGHGLEARNFSDAQISEFMGLLRQIDETCQPIPSAEFVGHHKDGRKLSVLCSIFAIPDTQGDKQYVFLDIDITERRRIENEILGLNAELEARVAKRTEELSGANDELRMTLDNLNRAQDELLRTEKLASLGALVAGVAHELNTPIGNAVTVSSTLVDAQKHFSEQLSSGLSRSALQAFVDTVGEAGQILERNLQRAAELVGSFKQLAVDQSSYQRRPFDLREVVHEVTLAMGPAVRKTQHQVRVDVAPGIRLDSYPGPLGQILMNLINNALIHAFADKQSGTIRIEADSIDSAWVTLTVSDDGRGISPEHQKRIFDPFFTTRLGQGGSGLGLHIVFNLVVDLLGGRIDVASIPGRGAAFLLRIPTAAPSPKVLVEQYSGR